MNNKQLWNKVCVTDPKAVKPITGKQYSGNSPKPYWIVERLTDEFGPCGIGWGFTIINERFERFSDTDTLHVAAVRFWYVLDGKRGELEQIGQTKSSYQSSAGKFILDEDAPKKSVTDALVKCASYLGFAGDIFSGRWDDSKYVAQAAAEWEERKKGGKESGWLESDERLSWLADWLSFIDEATSTKNLKERVDEAVKSAKSQNDADAEGQFLAAQATKMAKAKKEAA
jgi:hypothetical protein